MSSSLFTSLLEMTARDMTIERVRQGAFAPKPIRVAFSNYSRNLQIAQMIEEREREFVIPKDTLDKQSIAIVKRGDILVDAELGTFVITEVSELVFLGKVVGYRVRSA